jgi:hypothetical protein
MLHPLPCKNKILIDKKKQKFIQNMFTPFVPKERSFFAMSSLETPPLISKCICDHLCDVVIPSIINNPFQHN